MTIEEGVCDRTPQVIDEILREVGAGNCAEVEDRHLARTRAMWLFVNGDESEQARITPGGRAVLGGTRSARASCRAGYVQTHRPAAPARISGTGRLIGPTAFPQGPLHESDPPGGAGAGV